MKEGVSIPSEDKRQDFASCFTLSNLMAASLECYKGVRWKGQPQRFMNNRLTNCAELLHEIESGAYRPRKVEPFEINERGKTRTVKPVAFRDRVAQRCFCDNVLVPAIEDYVSVECSAVLPGRGMTYALDRVRNHAQKTPLDGWFFQYDFSKYFENIDKEYALAMLSRMIDDPRLIAFARSVLMEERGGLELGSHVSQLIAAAFASPVDFALDGVDGVVGHHRYMDDGIVFCDSKDSMLAAKSVVEEMSERLKLVINPKKVNYNKITHPFVFCKMRFSRHDDGSVRMNVRKKQSRRAVNHAKAVARLNETKGNIDIDPVFASLGGYLMRGDADLWWLVEKARRH